MTATKINRNKFYYAVREGREKLGMNCPGVEDDWVKFDIEDNGDEEKSEDKVRESKGDERGRVDPEAYRILTAPLVFPPTEPHPIVRRIDRITRVKKQMTVDWVVEIHNEGVMKRTKKKVAPNKVDDYLARIENSDSEGERQ